MSSFTHHLLLEQAEGHGYHDKPKDKVDTTHSCLPGVIIRRDPVLRLDGDHVAETDGRQGDEWEVGCVEEAPALPVSEDECPQG